jgi:rhodanese-related sulfurtransferase
VYEDYSPQQVAELLGQDGIQLVDVRERTEWDAGRIAGAVHIPLGELATHVESIDRERRVVFYCRTGARSAMAAEALDTAGYEAHNMAGGLVEWAGAGLALEPDDGYVA